jgi:DNA-binding IclR family transcriptional regulator
LLRRFATDLILFAVLFCFASVRETVRELARHLKVRGMSTTVLVMALAILGAVSQDETSQPCRSRTTG